MVAFDIETNDFYLETSRLCFESEKRFLREGLFSTHR